MAAKQQSAGVKPQSVRTSAAGPPTGYTDSGGQLPFTFGVGCVHFASLRESAANSKDKYFEDLKTYLLADNLISDFRSIEDGRESVVFLDKPTFISDDISEEKYLYPIINNYRILFNIHIPKRKQEEYLASWRAPLAIEDFLVEIDYTHSMPVLYVWVESDEMSPSSIVTIIWKHFEKANPKDEFIKFQMLGPSPFHADFYVESAVDDRFSIKFDERPGYDDVTIKAPNKLSGDKIKNAIRQRLTEELSMYYEGISSRNALYTKFESISDRIEKIIESNSIFIRAKRLIIGDPKVYQLSIEIEKTLLQSEQASASITDSRRHRAKDGEEILLATHIEGIVDDIRSIPIDRYLRIVNILRERHNIGRTNYSILFGAMIGALAAIIAGWLW